MTELAPRPIVSAGSADPRPKGSRLLHMLSTTDPKDIAILYLTTAFAFFNIYFWFPKMTGRMMDETLGKVHFWTTFIGFHGTFLVQHWLGAEGMPRRYADYLPTDGLTAMNTASSISSFILGASVLPFVYNVARSHRYGRPVNVDDPWGYGNSLEWATTSPPPRHNFTELPSIRSERPALELHYPHLVPRFRAEAGPNRSSPGPGTTGRARASAARQRATAGHHRHAGDPGSGLLDLLLDGTPRRGLWLMGLSLRGYGGISSATRRRLSGSGVHVR